MSREEGKMSRAMKTYSLRISSASSSSRPHSPVPPSSASANIASYPTSTFYAAFTHTTAIALPSSVASSATCEASPTHIPWRPQLVFPPGVVMGPGSTTLITWLVPVDNQKVIRIAEEIHLMNRFQPNH
uniref:Uncharacterized protein n=1 Tax=Triticum urartu TaxID=4572 RepID=A0A8R7QJY3_TRIUA